MQKRPDRFESARFALSAAAAHINGEIDLHHVRQAHALERQAQGQERDLRAGQVLLWDGNRQGLQKARARARARVHNAARRARQRTDACATHRGRAARRFEKALEVSRAQAILFTEDAFNHFWLQDDESKKGTWVCIGSTEVPAQTFPLLTKTNMCLKVGSTTFYIEEPPKVRRRRRCLLARAREREARARERARTRAIRRRRRRRRARADG